jgi:hypothetical protein
MSEALSILGISGLVSIGLLLGSLLAFLRARAFINAATKTQGRVVKLVEKSIGGGNSDFFPVFSFTTKDGQEITITQQANRPRVKAGAQVEVMYDPGQPQNAKINAWVNFYLFPALAAAAGLLVGVIGLISALKSLF